MTLIDYHQQDYHSFLKEIAPRVNGDIKENSFLQFNHSSLNGYARAGEVCSDLTYLVMEMHCQEEVQLKLIPDAGSYYILLLQTVLLNNAAIVKDIFFTRSSVKQQLSYPKESKVRMFSVCISKSWLEERIPCLNKDECLLEQMGGIVKEPLSTDYQYIFNDVVKKQNRHPLAGLHENNRVMQILEMFLKRAISKQIMDSGKPVRSLDRKRLEEVEKLLTQHLHTDPPSLRELSRVAGMSESSLKVKFKKLYGSGVSVYHRRHKMLKAKEMLQTGRYSVKEVGIAMGYSNLSHFSGAFRKEFNILPSELLILN